MILDDPRIGFWNRFWRVIFVRSAPRFDLENKFPLWNYSLALAQEWGEYWAKPIQSRLKAVYPEVSDSELDQLNSIAQEAMRIGYDMLYKKAGEEGSSKNLSDSAWREEYTARFPWVDKKNLRHLYRTGSYYAWKDFG